jgi:TolB-like protein/class 3 adenylate cyclase
MAEKLVQRRLAAILAADVVGYSRLMEEDEAGTLAALKARRKKVLEPLLRRHHGRIVKTMGDGVLVEFASAVTAVECAVRLQEDMMAANVEVPEGRRIVLRIGVNLGDIVIENGDLYGDGVNIAARLEAMADPGGICISGKVHDEIRGKIVLDLQDLGEREVKNIGRPIRVFRIEVGRKPFSDVTASAVSASKPAIAVLPFTNMSGDADQQYFSDGITEDIITELSRFRSLFVIARNSSFQFRGPAIDMGTVRRKLGVRYIVEGSVRRFDGRLRVTAQLIDAATETHLWAERYDRDMQDVFAVQDEVARTIAATLEGRVAASGTERAKRKPTRELAAYDYFLQGRERDACFDLAGAESFYARAIELDPGYVHAHALRAQALVVQYWLDQQPEKLKRAEAGARTALSLDDHDAASHDAMGYVAMHQRKFDLAGIHFDRAVSLNPNDVYIAADRANWLVRVGRLAEALQILEAAMQRDPFSPTWFWEVRFTALFHLNRYDEAIAALRNMSTFHFWHYAFFAAAYAHAGRPDDARRELATFLNARPAAKIALVAAAEPYAEPALLNHLLDGLRKAGLPE